MEQVKESVAKSAKSLLKYLLEDIDYKYEDATRREKTLVSEDEFNELVAWVKEA